MEGPKPPAKINNFKVNKPVVAKPRNLGPLIFIKPREVEEVKQVVNKKVADEKLIHKAKEVKEKVVAPTVSKGKSGVSNRRKRKS